jgi:hypothetical protein
MDGARAVTGMNEAASRWMRSTALSYGAAALCVMLVIANAVSLFPRQLGIDLYQFWGVPIAREISGTARTPYADVQGYSQTLNALSDASDSGKLRAANRLRRNLEPMGTPFLYAAFAFMPRDFERAQAAYAVLLHLTAGAAIVLLARLRGLRLLTSICVAALIEVSFNPFAQDVKVGNVNSLQLLFMAVMLHIAARRKYLGHGVLDSLFVGSLAVFVMFKPNTLWIAAALALHYWVVGGHRKFLAGVAMAFPMAALAFALGAWYFGTPAVWGEWLQFARALDGSGLPLKLQDGNLSLAMILSQGSSSYGSLTFGAIISVSLIVALYMAMSATGRRPELVTPIAREIFSDPWFAVSLGVLFTFATFPLVWPHYHVLAIIPMFWMFRRTGRWDAATWGVVLCYLGFSRPILELANTIDLDLTVVLVVFSWIALVPGAFLYVVERRRSLEASVAVTAPVTREA